MSRIWKLLLFAFAGSLLLAACTAPAEVGEVAPELAAVQEEVIVVDPVTAVPSTAIPTEETVIEAVEAELDVVEETAVTEESVDTIVPPPGEMVDKYVNVSYTQADAEDVIGETNRIQFVLAYSTW